MYPSLSLKAEVLLVRLVGGPMFRMHACFPAQSFKTGFHIKKIKLSRFILLFLYSFILSCNQSSTDFDFCAPICGCPIDGLGWTVIMCTDFLSDGWSHSNAPRANIIHLFYHTVHTNRVEFISAQKMFVDVQTQQSSVQARGPCSTTDRGLFVCDLSRLVRNRFYNAPAV